MFDFVSFIPRAIVQGIPLLFGSTGETLTEKSGNLNLGIAGVLLVSGTDHTITTTIAGGQGFTAVMVSWLAKFNPLGMIFTSFLLVFLDRGAGEISTVFGLNQSFADILSGIIIFFIIGCEFFINYKVQFRTSGKKEA